MRPYLVGIAGGTGAGKTTIARRLAEFLGAGHTVSVVDLDSYYKDLGEHSPAERERINFDHPGALDLERFLEDLSRLRQGLTVTKPVYDFITHTRRAEGVELAPGNVVIGEGLMLFVDDRVRNLFDLRIYIEVPAGIRVLRRVERDVCERGRALSGVLSQYLTSVRPMHDRFIEPTKRHAHVVLSGSGHNEEEFTDLATMIRRSIGKEGAPHPSSTGVALQS